DAITTDDYGVPRRRKQRGGGSYARRVRAVAAVWRTRARQAHVRLLVNDITGQGDEDGPTRRILGDFKGTRDNHRDLFHMLQLHRPFDERFRHGDEIVG